LYNYAILGKKGEKSTLSPGVVAMMSPESQHGIQERFEHLKSGYVAISGRGMLEVRVMI
jgi:hypothetical protein